MKNPFVLVIEDSAYAVHMADQVLRDLGIELHIAFSDVKKAVGYLEEVTDGEKRRPDLILLDLDFGRDSGFEVLRLWKTHPELHPCKIVVWTAMGRAQQELSMLFGVENVVPKNQGASKLSEVLSKIIEPLTHSAGSS